MSKYQIIDRTYEISTLEQLFYSNRPEFLALYGRCRVSKTYLIRQVFSNKDVIFSVLFQNVWVTAL